LFRNSDVVSLEAGPVFADMRVVAVNTVDMLVDNSMITGDPEPVPRSVRAQLPPARQSLSGSLPRLSP
jgi:hypothetical protein